MKTEDEKEKLAVYCRAAGLAPFFLAETDSTNRCAAAYAHEHPGARAVFLAERQSAGEGRLGRRFESPAGAGLYMTVLLCPTLPPEKVLRLTVCAAVATRRAILRLCGRAPDIKWVNDLLFDGKKVAGILAKGKLAEAAGAPSLAYAALGIGVNIRPAEKSPEVAALSTTLWEATGKAPSPYALARAILEELPPEDGMQNPSRMAEYRAASMLIGRDVAVLTDGKVRFTARVLDVTDSGALRIFHDGVTEDLTAGEVSVRPCEGVER